MAEAALAGARRETDRARLLPPDAATPADLLAAAGLILACPENLAAPSGAMKEFIDRAYYPCLDRLNGRPYALLICAGTDGAGAVRALERATTGWRMRPIAAPIIHRTGAQTPDAIAAPKTIPPAVLAACADLGQAMAAGLAMGIM